MTRCLLNNGKFIKTGHENKPVAELSGASINVLAGVTEAQQKAMESIGNSNALFGQSAR